jgi:hypothetical protein
MCNAYMTLPSHSRMVLRQCHATSGSCHGLQSCCTCLFANHAAEHPLTSFDNLPWLPVTCVICTHMRASAVQVE